MPVHRIFLGTYTKNESRGIYTVTLDSQTGALSTPLLVAETPNPAWITFSPDKKSLYAIHESQAQAVGYAVDGTDGRLTPLPRSPLADVKSPPPSHLAVDASGRTLLAANYGEGYVAAIAIGADGELSAPNVIRHEGSSMDPKRQEKPHVHSVTLSPDNRHVIVGDLGVDKIFSYALDAAAAQLSPANPPFVRTAPGAGPRHFKFGGDGRHAYAINELNNTVTAYAYDAKNGALTSRASVSTLPSDVTIPNTTAEIRVHPNGKFVYGSNRGHDSLVLFAVDSASGALTFVEAVSSGGKTPRNFALSPDGAWLVCGHQDSGGLTVFNVHPTTGRLTPTNATARLPMCVCILFYD